MLWLLTLPIIWFYTFKNICYDSNFPTFDDERNFLGWAFAIFVSAFISFLISLVPLIIASIIGSWPERRGVADRKYPLVALREKDGQSGRAYFLGAGFIEDVQYYFWYRRNSDGSISGGKTVRDPGVRIYEDASEPYMQTFKTEYANPGVKKYLWLFGIDSRGDESWNPTFHIPAGSVQEGYKL
jgi:hypothetical protein